MKHIYSLEGYRHTHSRIDLNESIIQLIKLLEVSLFVRDKEVTMTKYLKLTSNFSGNNEKEKQHLFIKR